MRSKPRLREVTKSKSHEPQGEIMPTQELSKSKIRKSRSAQLREKLDKAASRYRVQRSQGLERNAPERGIGLGQFEPGVPRFVVAPHDQRFGLAASFWMDQSNLLVHR